MEKVCNDLFLHFGVCLIAASHSQLGGYGKQVPLVNR